MITRGGVIPGGLLAEALNMQHLLTASVDFVATEQSGMRLGPPFSNSRSQSAARRRALIVDDVWGSGRTSISVRERVDASGGRPVNCVLHYNPYRTMFSNMKPDLYGDVTDAYVVYPWEIDRGLLGRDFPQGQPESDDFTTSFDCNLCQSGNYGL